MIHPLFPRISCRPPASTRRVPLGLVIFAASCLQHSAVADSFTFDANGNAGDGINDAAGTWNTSATNWYKDTAIPNIAWPNTTDSIAIFGANRGAAGVQLEVTVGTVTANGIVFNQANSSTGGAAQGYLLKTGTITLGGTAPSVTVNGPTATITARLTASTFSKQGAGTLVVNNSGNNLGAVSIDAGILDIFSTLVTTDVVVAAGAKFDTHSNTTWSMNSLTYNSATGSNLTSLSDGSVSTYTIGAGGLTISTGTINVTAGTNVASSARSTLNLNGNLNMSGGTLNISTSTSSPTAQARVVLRGNINATGNATISSAGPGSQSLDLDGGIRTIDVGTSTATTFSLNAVTTNGGLTKTGNGILSLGGTAANTYAGMTTVSGGTLALNKTAGITAIAGDITVATGGTLDWNFANQVADTAHIYLTGGSLKTDSLTETIANLTQSAGTVNGSQSNGGVFTITGALTVTGGQAINLNSAGQWRAGSASFSGVSTAISLNGNSDRVTLFTVDGNLTLTGQTISINKGDSVTALGSELALNGSVTASGNNAINTGGTSTNGKSVVNLREGIRVWNITSGTTTINSDVMSLNPADGPGAPRTAVVGGLEKTGTGALVFNGNNGYTGNTTVSAGTFRLGASASIDSTLRITVAPAATLDVSAVTGGFTVKMGQTLEGGGTIIGAVSANSGSTIAAGTASGDTTQTLSFNTGLKLSSGSLLKLDLVGPGDFGKVVVTGSLTQETGAKLKLGPDVFTGALSIGQTFDLLDWTTGFAFSTNLGDRFRTGAEDNFLDLDLPDITATGYLWDTGNFTTNGTVAVVVPEPGTVTLLAGAFALLGLRRRRPSPGSIYSA